MPDDQYRAEEILKISQMDALLYNNVIFINILIPLVEQHPFIYYKLHSLPVFDSNYKFSLSIRPSHDFIAVSLDDNKYFKFNKQQLFDCIHTHYGELCDIMSPLHIMDYTQDCEISLLMHANLPHPKSCNVILEPKNTIVLKFLDKSNGWLYAIGKEINTRLHCHSKLDQIYNLNDTGILYIPENCTLNLGSEIIYNTKHISDNIPYANIQHQKLSIPHFVNTHYASRAAEIFKAISRLEDTDIPIELRAIATAQASPRENDTTFYILLVILTSGGINFILIIALYIIFIHKSSRKSHNSTVAVINNQPIYSTVRKSNSLSKSFRIKAPKQKSAPTITPKAPPSNKSHKLDLHTQPSTSTHIAQDISQLTSHKTTCMPKAELDV